MQRLILGISVASALALLASPSEAQVSPYVGLGVGPAVQIDDWPTQFRVEQEIGLTFGGRDGFFLAFAPSQSWGANHWVAVFPVRLGGIFDLFHNRDVRFQLGGSGTVGFAIDDEFDTPRRDPDLWFHLSVGMILRILVLDDRLGFYIRPVTFEFALGPDNNYFGNEAIRYVAAGGVQYYF